VDGASAGKLFDCENNVMVWLGAGSFPKTLPTTFNGKSCFTLMTGQAGWTTGTTPPPSGRATIRAPWRTSRRLSSRCFPGADREHDADGHCESLRYGRGRPGCGGRPVQDERAEHRSGTDGEHALSAFKRASGSHHQVQNRLGLARAGERDLHAHGDSARRRRNSATSAGIAVTLAN